MNNIPAVGLGTWKLEDAEKVVIKAIQLGYRHIDCASFYKNETEVGNALNYVLSNQQIITRKDLFITSKLWVTDHGRVKEACFRTLSRLQLEYLDLYLIHWPIAFEPDPGKKNKLRLAPISVQQTWRQMEELVDAGLVKNIGVCNFNVQSLFDLLSYARIKPMVNQIEVHPYLVQQDLIKLSYKLGGIKTVAYSPLGSGKLPEMLVDPSLIKIATKHKRTVCEIILRWLVQRGLIVIPRSTNEDRLKQNLDVVDGPPLDDKDMTIISGLDKNSRIVDPKCWGGVKFFS
jgi:diketogulonate reductase-like aldo/keto reductase